MIHLFHRIANNVQCTAHPIDQCIEPQSIHKKRPKPQGLDCISIAVDQRLECVSLKWIAPIDSSSEEVEDVGSRVGLLDTLKGLAARGLALRGVVGGEELVKLARVGGEAAVDVGTDGGDGSDDHEDGEDPGRKLLVMLIGWDEMRWLRGSYLGTALGATAATILAVWSCCFEKVL